MSERRPEWIRESNLIEGVNDPLEDRRCLRAWNELQGKPWSVETVLWLHRRIMSKIRPDIAGKWRDCDVVVGGYDAPPPNEARVYIREWVELEGVIADYEDGIKAAHVRFEKIHPFEDGNGRVGRMLMNWQRVRAGLEPLCIPNEQKRAYYAWFD